MESGGAARRPLSPPRGPVARRNYLSATNNAAKPRRRVPGVGRESQGRRQRRSSKVSKPIRPAARRGWNRSKLLLAPPGRPLARWRWIFLLSSLLMVFFQIYMILTVDVAVWPLRTLGVASLVGLCWLWYRGYRHVSFPSASFVVESIAIFGVALAVGNRRFPSASSTSA